MALSDSHTSEAAADDIAGEFGIGFHSTFPLIGFQRFLMRAGITVLTEDPSASVIMLGGRFLYTVQRKARPKFYLGARVNYSDASVR